MPIYDVTLPLRPDLPTWPGEPGPRYEPIARISAGDPANVTRLILGSHTGTHVDPPGHYIEGAGGVDSLDPTLLVGPAYVARLDAARSIDRATLDAAAIPPGTVRLILRTPNSNLWNGEPTAFTEDYVGVTPDGADWLIERGTRLVGIDYLSIEPYDSPGNPVHRRLLGEGIVVIEGLDLRRVPAGPCELFCGPLRLPGIDGSPARVFLTRQGDDR